MTKVIFYRNRDGLFGYEVEGHSGYASEGEDIVCAAISVSTWQVYHSVSQLTKDKPHLIEDEANAYIRCEFTKISEKSKLLLESYFLTIRHLTEVYPEYISLKIEEVE